MYPSVISKKAQHLLALLSQKHIIKDFYLAGGTAVALQFGHRKSKDFDFFTQRDFSNRKLKQSLSQIGKIKILTEEEGTLNIILGGIRFSFFHYKYRIISPLIKFRNIKLAGSQDIACMKLNAISSRGSKKDFIDLYFLLKKYSFDKLFNSFDKKYKDIEYNKLHILRSLTFFSDADKEPMPLMINKINWLTVKKEIRRNVKAYLL